MAVETIAAARSTPLQRFLTWARRVQLERTLAFVFLGAGITLGIATFVALNDRLPSARGTWFVVLLLYLDLVPLLGLAALIARRLVIIWIAHKRGTAGAKLHARLVALFSLVAVTPAIIVATFSIALFDFGLQNWFSQRVSTAITESLAVAEAYLEDHRQTIKSDVLNMAYDLNQQGSSLVYSPRRLNQFVSLQSALRDLTEAQVTDGSGRVLARSGFSLLLDFNPRLPPWAMRQASEGEVVLLTTETDDRVRAVVRLTSFDEAYLLVGRLVEPRVLGHMNRDQGCGPALSRARGQALRAAAQLRADLRRGGAAALARCRLGRAHLRQPSDPPDRRADPGRRAGPRRRPGRAGQRGRGRQERRARLARPRLQPHDRRAAEPAPGSCSTPTGSSTTGAASLRQSWPGSRPASSASTVGAGSTT